jgi:hypothetical protein
MDIVAWMESVRNDVGLNREESQMKKRGMCMSAQKFVSREARIASLE